MSMADILSDNDFELREAAESIATAREALLRVDPHPSEKARLARVQKLIHDVQAEIATLLQTNSPNTTERKS